MIAMINSIRLLFSNYSTVCNVIIASSLSHDVFRLPCLKLFSRNTKGFPLSLLCDGNGRFHLSQPSEHSSSYVNRVGRVHSSGSYSESDLDHRPRCRVEAVLLTIWRREVHCTYCVTPPSGLSTRSPVQLPLWGLRGVLAGPVFYSFASNLANAEGRVCFARCVEIGVSV